MRTAWAASWILALCVQAYRDSDNVGHLASVENLHLDPGNSDVEGAHDTVKNDKADPQEDAEPDCHSEFTSLKNWDVKFEQLQDKIGRFVRVPEPTSDPEDKFGKLVEFSGENIAVHLGASISFKKDDGNCQLKPEEIRFSPTPTCEKAGMHLNTTDEADSSNGHPQFFMMTDAAVVVLKRELMGNDTNASLKGDWTFEYGDFSVTVADGQLQLKQKFWDRDYVCNGTVESADPKEYHHITLGVAEKECLKHKEEECNKKDYCKFISAEDKIQCKVKDDMNACGHIRLKASPPNSLVREFSLDNKSDWKKFVAHRSFTPTDAELSGFVCVFTNSSWVPVRGMTFKQISGMGPSKNLAKNAVNDHGQKLFTNVSHGRTWLQEKRQTFATTGDKEFLPPWRNALQGTVEWKKAGVCPPNYPLCMSDGSCALRECQGGCEWSRAPSPWADPSGGYNYIRGYDSFGTECDINSDADAKKSSAATSSAVLALSLTMAWLWHM